MGSPLQLVGQTFGRLTVLERGEKRGNNYTWVCECSCGGSAVVVGSTLMAGNTKSCGCLQKEVASTVGKTCNTTHGLSNHELYGVYNDIKKRCFNEKSPAYPRYGGRGITMCDEWASSFEQFLKDVGERPFPEATLDREENDGNYDPSNVRWATKATQARNQRKYKNNTSGVTGVNLINRTSKHPCWMARVSHPVTLEDMNKSFSINKFGNDEAFRLACEWREAMLDMVNEKLGAGYSENHGL